MCIFGFSHLVCWDFKVENITIANVSKNERSLTQETRKSESEVHEKKLLDIAWSGQLVGAIGRLVEL